jgi:hypothetical protein
MEARSVLQEEQEAGAFSIKPVTINDVLLLSPGRWNDTEYTLEELLKAYSFTNWNDKKFTALYMDHQDTKERGVANWVGYVKNPRMTNNELRGDLEIWNPLMGVFLEQAKAKFGVSATLAGREVKNPEGSRMEDYHFESFSIVTDPACKPAWINLSEENKDLNVVTVSSVSSNNSEKMTGVSTERCSTEPVKASDAIVLKGGIIEMPNLKSENEIKKLAEEEEVPEQATEEITEAQTETPSETPSEAEASPEAETSETPSEELSEDKEDNEDDKDEKDDKDKKEEEDKSLSDDAILNKIKGMDAKELAEYTNFVKEHLSKNLNATASEITLAYLNSKEIEQKKLSGEALLEALDSKIAAFKELDSTKELSELKEQVKELQEKTKMPDRKTLSVGYEGLSAQDSNLGMLGFLSKRLN